MNMLTYDWQKAVRHIAAADPGLARVIRAAGPARLEIKRYRSPYEYLLRAIIFQQLAGKAATTIHGRLLDLFPARRPKPELLLRTSAPKLRQAGVSSNKQKAIKDLARRAAKGEIPTFAKLARMEDEAIIQTLTQVHGVGRWTVEMLLMFQLGRPDVLPVNDLGVQKGFAKACGMALPPKPKELEQLADHWRPYRSVGSWLCWRALEL
ncbi:MAG: DNA-3-methyladenine glycosylase 2 family protein [Planctomycetes bacterium]|nr:DNA-3-methyladenine glycosylase 2 family protein [Planctomycetota bacterium]